MACGWDYAKLSLSSALRLSFSGMCILLFLFLSVCRFLCLCFSFALIGALKMYVDEQADAGRDCRTRLARPNSQARTRTEKY